MTGPDTFSVVDKLVWVAGADNAVGHEVASLFSSRGARVFTTGSDPTKPPTQGLHTKCDLTNTADLGAALALCEQLGPLDALVNCSIAPVAADPMNVGEQGWHDEFDGALKGAFLCSQAAARAMIRHGRRGSIVNVGSIDADLHYPDATIDSIVHGGLNTMTRAMAVALAPHNLRVNVVASAIGADPKHGRAIGSPLGPIDASTGIPPAAVFLTSQAASFITGTVLVVDGGRMASL